MKRSTFLLLIALFGFCWNGGVGNPISVLAQTADSLQVISIRGQLFGPKGKSVEEYEYLEPGKRYRLLPEAKVELSSLDGSKIYIAVGPGLLSFDSPESVSLNGKLLSPETKQSSLQGVIDTKMVSRELAGLTFRGISVATRTAEGKTKLLPLYSGYHALVVGVSNYEQWPKLPNALRDAKDLADKLKELGFKVKLVLDPTYREMRTSLTDLVYGLGRDRNRAVLLYYAGHGETETLADRTRMGYIIPKDCPVLAKDPRGFATHAISMKDIEAYSLQIRSKHVLMMFDSCFSGALFALVRAVPDDITEKSTMPVRQYITAGREDEKVPDQSMFKRCLLIGLDGDADLTKDGYITGSELGMYLADKVVNYTHRRQHPQYGKINNPDLDRGDFIFVPLKIRQKVVEKEKTHGEERTAIAEELSRLREDRKKNQELVDQMKKLLEAKWDFEQKAKETLAEKRELEEKLKRAEEDRLKSEELSEAKVRELETQRKASLEKLQKQTAAKEVLEEELRRKADIENRLKSAEEQRKETKALMEAKIRVLEVGRKAAEEKAHEEFVAKKALEARLRRLNSEVEESSKAIEVEKTKPPQVKHLAHIPKEAKDAVVQRMILRSTPKELSESDVRTMLANHNFFAKSLNESGSFIGDLTDNGYGTVTDRATGLMWQSGGSKTALSYSQAEEYVHLENIGGLLKLEGYPDYRGWRIPTLEELCSILSATKGTNGGRIGPLFKEDQKECWSSDKVFSLHPRNISYYSVDLMTGEIGRSTTFNSFRPGDNIVERCFVRLVRTAQEGQHEEKRITANGTFIANDDGTVFDTKTNLMWAAQDSGRGLFEHAAKEYIRDYRAGGHTDWRMPTPDELRTIFEPSTTNNYGYHVTKLINISGEWVWAAEGWGSANGFSFTRGSSALAMNLDPSRALDTFDRRALPVRDAKNMKPRAIVEGNRREEKGRFSEPEKSSYIRPPSTPDVIKRDGVYVAYANGIVRDTKTGLEWKAGPDRNTDWNEARSWVESLNLDGGGWRMPSTNELEGLYKKGAGSRNMTPLLKTTGWWVWSGETKGSSDAWHSDFANGDRDWISRFLSFSSRAFAVRSSSN
jgi:hypothetical protein